MVADKDTAKQVAAMLLDAGAMVDRAVAVVHDSSPEDESTRYKVASGKVMAAILDILNPLFTEHPELAPPQMVHWYTSGNPKVESDPDA